VSILDVIFPKLCVGCRKEEEYICDTCQRKLIIPTQICPMCSKPSLDGWTHPKCRKVFGMERLIIGLSYHGMVQQCLKKVKYKSAWDVLSFLYSLTNFGELGTCVVTSVPMWRQKERERGFNQAEILAELTAKNYKGTNLVILKRIKETKPMYGLKKEDRLENIAGAFSVNTSLAGLQGLTRIILVDDVWTTGATMRECAYILKRAGIAEVWGVTLAK
jgi:ComF family protein